MGSSSFSPAAGSAAGEITEGNYTVSLPLNVHSDKLGSLMQEFMRQAQVGADGKTITLGSFEAKKAGVLSTILSDANWDIYESLSAKKVFRGAIGMEHPEGATAQNDQQSVIAYLAWQEAQKHYTQQDRKDALRRALQLKLDSLS